jgi:hypothetical protein
MEIQGGMDAGCYAPKKVSVNASHKNFKFGIYFFEIS